MLRPRFAVWLLVASFAAWLASCSSNVDGYFIATTEAGSHFAGGAGPGGSSSEGGAGSGAMGQAQKTGGSGPGGGSGGLDFDAADGPSLVASGGRGNGGAGGADASVTGGAQNSGGALATGGAPNSGGSGATGGATGGTGGGSGGATGGTPNSGGAPTGGTGGGSGGAPTGGTGGGSGGATGGTGGGSGGTGGGSGGATGGTGGGSGGSGGTGYPGNPVQVPLVNASGLGGITAAAWEPTSRRFFLLQYAARQYWIVATDGTASGPFALSGTGSVSPTTFGASTTNVYFASGSTSTLYRQPISGGTAFSKAIPGNPNLTLLSGAFANGWFFMGNSGGAGQALAEGQTNFDANAPNITSATVVTTDGVSFAFRTIGSANDSVISRIAPGSFAVDANPCSAGGFNSNRDFPVAVYGTSVAWVILFPFATNPYQLNLATTSSGTCDLPMQLNFGNSTNGSPIVGLISSTDALITPLVTGTGGTVTIDIKRPADPTFSRTPITVNLSANGSPTALVVAAEAPAQTHYAMLVTKNVPVLLSF